ncbi:TCP-1/cpn60 chaperonin family protein [Streptomyces gardneri]|uniref:TCP-1/cpn60 chaperonin family protein n=1 Tax=Streptomyces gardneri TaxID=66892 RepID=UPI0035DACB93
MVAEDTAAAEVARINLKIDTSDFASTNALGQGTQINQPKINIEQIVYNVALGQTSVVAGQLAAGGIDSVDVHPLVVASGIVAAAKHVRRTLGPARRAARVRGAHGGDYEVFDAHGVATIFEPGDARERLGAGMIRDLVHKVGAEVSDGSATAVVLANAMVLASIRELSTGTPSVQVATSLQAAAVRARELLSEIAVPAQSEEQVRAAAFTATNDAQISDMLAQVWQRAGSLDAVLLEENSGTECSLELSDGMSFPWGLSSGRFMTNEERGQAILDDAALLIIDDWAPSVGELLPYVERLFPTQRPLILLADDLPDDVLSMLIVNVERGNFPSAAVKAPSSDQERRALLQDIAVATGGQVVTAGSDSGVYGEDLDRFFGRAQRAVVTATSTVLIGTGGEDQQVTSRAQEIRSAIERVPSGNDRARLRGRLARLEGGAAVLKIGGFTKHETEHRIDVAEKGLAVSRSAVKRGLLPGGGAGLLQLRSVAESSLNHGELNSPGWRILIAALADPTQQLRENSGQAPSLEELESQASVGQCFDLVAHRYGDVATGVADSARVMESAMSAAVDTTIRFLDLL